MKALIASALLAAVALPLTAQELVSYDDHFVSTRSRAQVSAETARAGSAGELAAPGEYVEYPRARFTSASPSRAEVQAELARARAAGELSSQNEITSEPRHAMRGQRPQLARTDERTGR